MKGGVQKRALFLCKKIGTKSAHNFAPIPHFICFMAKSPNHLVNRNYILNIQNWLSVYLMFRSHLAKHQGLSGYGLYIVKKRYDKNNVFLTSFHKAIGTGIAVDKGNKQNQEKED